jgi:hypothetical protein
MKTLNQERHNDNNRLTKAERKAIKQTRGQRMNRRERFNESED